MKQVKTKPILKSALSPVRKIGKSYKTLTGRLHLPGIDRRIAFESPLERDFFILQWFDPLLTDMVEQPVKVPYEMAEGKSSFYTPDALVCYRGKPSLLVEVKPDRFLRKNKRELQPKFDAARQFAEERGWIFCIFDEKDIRCERFHLAQYMLRFAREPYRKEELHKIVEILIDLGRRASFATVLRSAQLHGMMREDVTRLIQQAMAHRLIAYDETFPVTMETTLLVKGQGGVRLVERGT